MKRFIEGENRSQTTLFPESLDDYIAEDNAVRFIDAFVNKLDCQALGFRRAEPSATGRPGYHPSTMMLCRKLDLFADAFVAIDGSMFKAVNNRHRNFTKDSSDDLCLAQNANTPGRIIVQMKDLH